MQSYNFNISVNDLMGSFSLIFFPNTGETANENLFDKIKTLDVVEIYESKAGKESSRPVFTGIVKTKKFVAQASENGNVRRLSISGFAITSLVSQFTINLDIKAMALSKQFANNDNLRTALTLELSTNPGEELSLKFIVKKIWDYFVNLSINENIQGLTTTKIKKYITAFMGDDFIESQDILFHYPLGSVFNAEGTQDFWSLIDDLLPSPIYEKFAYTDTETGLMKIKIRQVPFSEEDWTTNPITESDWVKLPKKKIEAIELKDYELIQSDNEVYTVFYSYVLGSPFEFDKALILATQENAADSTIIHDKEKFEIYGYKPLICMFRGYGSKDGSPKDTTTESNMKSLNAKLRSWYGKMDEMLSGSITIAMTYDDEKQIMPGDRVSFLDGEFYVDGISHSWSYGQGGDVNLSVSRGGKYFSDGSFYEFTGATDINRVYGIKQNTTGDSSGGILSLSRVRI
ncbi:MAG: hypothetical protein ACRC4W_00180 [Treponemataceae bacterium]